MWADVARGGRADYFQPSGFFDAMEPSIGAFNDLPPLSIDDLLREPAGAGMLMCSVKSESDAEPRLLDESPADDDSTLLSSPYGGVAVPTKLKASRKGARGKKRAAPQQQQQHHTVVMPISKRKRMDESAAKCDSQVSIGTRHPHI
jgi:hypothetical protein